MEIPTLRSELHGALWWYICIIVNQVEALALYHRNMLVQGHCKWQS